MKFLIDNQLPIALSRWLSAQGVESCQVLDIHLDEVSDHQIWP
jgi:predicted nuclease of predicted toxin-antitoxin system